MGLFLPGKISRVVSGNGMPKDQMEAGGAFSAPLPRNVLKKESWAIRFKSRPRKLPVVGNCRRRPLLFENGFDHSFIAATPARSHRKTRDKIRPRIDCASRCRGLTIAGNPGALSEEMSRPYSRRPMADPAGEHVAHTEGYRVIKCNEAGAHHCWPYWVGCARRKRKHHAYERVLKTKAGRGSQFCWHSGWKAQPGSFE